jgi:hypothetical protein
MLKPFSVTYWIGKDSFAKQSGLACLLPTAIAFTTESETLFEQTIVNNSMVMRSG